MAALEAKWIILRRTWGGAAGVGAFPGNFAWESDCLGGAGWALCWKFIGGGGMPKVVFNGLDDGGDDFSGFFDDYFSADSDFFTIDFVFVMEGSARNG